MFMAGAVAVYVHVRDPSRPILSISKFRAETPAPSQTPGQIVIAPFEGGTLAERWSNLQAATATPTPKAKP